MDDLTDDPKDSGVEEGGVAENNVEQSAIETAIANAMSCYLELYDAIPKLVNDFNDAVDRSVNS